MSQKVSELLQATIQEMRPHAEGIHIRTVKNGFQVEIGCAHFVFQSKSKMLAAISDYLETPGDAAVAYFKRQDELNPAPLPGPEPGREPILSCAVGEALGATRVGYPDQVGEDSPGEDTSVEVARTHLDVDRS